MLLLSVMEFLQVWFGHLLYCVEAADRFITSWDITLKLKKHWQILTIESELSFMDHGWQVEWVLLILIWFITTDADTQTNTTVIFIRLLHHIWCWCSNYRSLSQPENEHERVVGCGSWSLWNSVLTSQGINQCLWILWVWGMRRKYFDVWAIQDLYFLCWALRDTLNRLHIIATSTYHLCWHPEEKCFEKLVERYLYVGCTKIEYLSGIQPKTIPANFGQKRDNSQFEHVSEGSGGWLLCVQLGWCADDTHPSASEHLRLRPEHLFRCNIH